MMNVHGLVALLFGFRARVTRRVYWTAGVSLFALKYAVDLGLSSWFASNPLPPFEYLNPVLSRRLEALGQYPSWLPVLMLAWALPFIWVGVSMSARRAASAGQSPWLGLLFLVPVLNYLLIVLLCAAGDRPPGSVPPLGGKGAEPLQHREYESALARLRVAARSVLAAGAFGALAAVFSIFGLKQYGSALFVGAPFLLGVISGVLSNRPRRQSVEATLAVAATSVTLTGGVLLVLALEGVLCLAMAAMLAYPLAILGALLGRALASDRRPIQPALSMLAAWPLLALVARDDVDRFPLRSAVTSLEVAAPPERVWENLIAFSPLPPPHEWLLQVGVACPLSARIVGEGVGAVRYCEFTTGAFVEPITAWDSPYRLAFDVAAQPPSMREWSPYEVVHAPHLHGGVQSVRGEFKLTRLPGERTRLEGTTWYRLKMTPLAYWSLYSDHVIHVIHRRVLEHIRQESENAALVPVTLSRGRP